MIGKFIVCGEGVLSPRLREDDAWKLYPGALRRHVDGHYLQIGEFEIGGEKFFVSLRFEEGRLSFINLFQVTIRNGVVVSYDLENETEKLRSYERWVKIFFGASAPIERMYYSVRCGLEHKAMFASIHIEFVSPFSWIIRAPLAGIAKIVEPFVSGA